MQVWHGHVPWTILRSYVLLRSGSSEKHWLPKARADSFTRIRIMPLLLVSVNLRIFHPQTLFISTRWSTFKALHSFTLFSTIVKRVHVFGRGRVSVALLAPNAYLLEPRLVQFTVHAALVPRTVKFIDSVFLTLLIYLMQLLVKLALHLKVVQLLQHIGLVFPSRVIASMIMISIHDKLLFNILFIFIANWTYF